MKSLKYKRLFTKIIQYDLKKCWLIFSFFNQIFNEIKWAQGGKNIYNTRKISEGLILQKGYKYLRVSAFNLLIMGKITDRSFWEVWDKLVLSAIFFSLLIKHL